MIDKDKAKEAYEDLIKAERRALVRRELFLLAIVEKLWGE